MALLPKISWRVGIKNHKNGALNPKAQFNKSIIDLMNSRIEKAKQKVSLLLPGVTNWNFSKTLRPILW
jgi:hypothetical protein